jgi:hypothetical protein
MCVFVCVCVCVCVCVHVQVDWESEVKTVRMHRFTPCRRGRTTSAYYGQSQKHSAPTLTFLRHILVALERIRFQWHDVPLSVSLFLKKDMLELTNPVGPPPTRNEIVMHLHSFCVHWE